MITDSLTGLPNGYGGAELVSDMIRRKEAFANVLIDLNGFKTINDSFGFDNGNETVEETTRKIAAFLDDHPAVKKVYYPGLPSHPGHELAKRQSTGFGGMISFDIGKEENVDLVLGRLKWFTIAESLGAVESLISVPARMTHASIPPERRLELGITDGLIRISAGVEDIDDLLEDLQQALAPLS